MTNKPVPTFLQATRYEVAALPETNPNYPKFRIFVEYQPLGYPGGGLWSVHDNVRCYDIDGNPSTAGTTVYGRDAAWTKAHRFGLEAAWALAEKVAQTYQVNGRTAADIYDGDITKAYTDTHTEGNASS